MNRPGKRKCPARICNQMVPYSKAFCSRCWFQLPKATRHAINASFYAGNVGTRGHIELLLDAAKMLNGDDKPTEITDESYAKAEGLQDE